MRNCLFQEFICGSVEIVIALIWCRTTYIASENITANHVPKCNPCETDSPRGMCGWGYIHFTYSQYLNFLMLRVCFVNVVFKTGFEGA